MLNCWYLELVNNWIYVLVQLIGYVKIRYFFNPEIQYVLSISYIYNSYHNINKGVVPVILSKSNTKCTVFKESAK